MNIEEQDFVDIDGDNRETIDFDNILEQRIKLGKTQLSVFIASSILWLADGAEMLVIGFILPVIAKHWDLSEVQINWLGSVVFLSWALGAIYVGKVADKIGRKKPMIIGAAGQFISAVLSAFAMNYGLLIFLRGCFGFFLGLTAPISVTNFSEAFPKKNRGRYFVAASSFFIAGELITVFMAYLCLDSITSGNWRLLLLWSSLPGAVALLFISTQIKESPRYLLLCTDQYERAFKIINKMIKKNHRKNKLYEALQIKEYEKPKVLRWVEESKKQNLNEKNNKIKTGYKQLFKKEYKYTTIKLMLMWFSLSFIYYGIMYILPTTLIKMHGTEAHKDKITKNDDDFENNQNDFLGIAATTLIEIPSSLFVMMLIENKKIGRKNFMTIAYGMCALFCLVTFFYTKPDRFFFFLVSGAKVTIGFCFAVIYPFTAEIYSTNIRAAGCGLNNSICRLGGVLMPWLSFLFFFISNTGPFLVYFAICLLSFAASYKLRVDTTNLELDKFVKNQKKEQLKLEKHKQENDDVISVISKQSQDKMLHFGQSSSLSKSQNFHIQQVPNIVGLDNSAVQIEFKQNQDVQIQEPNCQMQSPPEKNIDIQQEEKQVNDDNGDNNSIYLNQINLENDEEQ